MAEPESGLDAVIKQLQLLEKKPSIDVGQRIQESALLIEQYLHTQGDREKAYRELKERVQKDKKLDFIYQHI
jgi:hypothetical protein